MCKLLSDTCTIVHDYHIICCIIPTELNLRYAINKLRTVPKGTCISHMIRTEIGFKLKQQ